MAYLITSECIQCGACSADCEAGAIKEGESQHYIDVAVCVECGRCVDSCPTGAIVFEEVKAS
jgi:ferredoxin